MAHRSLRVTLPVLLASTLSACGGSGAAAGVDAGRDAGGGGVDAEAPVPDGGAPAESGSPADAGGGSPEAAAIVDGASGGADAGTVLSRTYSGHQYLLYVPASYVAGTAAPLVLMLHGCTQDPADFAAGTRMNAQAEAAGVLVGYPDEPTSSNPEKCWNWFLPADQARGGGEPALLAGLVGDVAKDFTVDGKRVFAAGISAGAAMAVVLGATYPDVFAAIAVHSGLEFQAATDATSALSASASGGPNPVTQGDLAYQAMGTAGRAVPVVVFQGDADSVVNAVNGQQVASQWVETDTRAGLSLAAPATSNGTGGTRSFTLTSYATTTSTPVVELYVVHGLGHAWSGGSPAGTYTDPAGPDATSLIWQFFSTHPLP